MNQSRRHFLKSTLGASALLTFAPRVPGFLARAGEAARRRPGPDETVLVVLQLSGGNDGLNSIVPFADDAYAKARPTLRLREHEVLRLNGQLGFHPRLAAFKALHDEGLLGILQGVGCARLSRNHDALLEQLAAAVSAFVRDLRRHDLLDRVLLMTFSEFGRTLAENGRRVTDHGAAAPVFLSGGGVAGGLRGEHPSLTDLDEGGLRHRVDFRQLYAAVLGDWLGLDSHALLGDAFEPAPLWDV